MNKLYFGNLDNKILLKENIATSKELMDVMKEYLNKINFKSHYYRFWTENDYLFIDFGSHINFFITESSALNLLQIKDEKKGEDNCD